MQGLRTNARVSFFKYVSGGTEGDMESTYERVKSVATDGNWAGSFEVPTGSEILLHQQAVDEQVGMVNVSADVPVDHKGVFRIGTDVYRIMFIRPSRIGPGCKTVTGVWSPKTKYVLTEPA